MTSSNNGGVPPGFRFHPTDEELLHYYLKKKVSFEKFDLEVIREVDLNKMEPWDLQERCKIGSTPQNEWYFFSHKDRKYPTGSRTNRATNAGFWKATGRDKCIRNTFKKIGMRKTLVFYRGRAPHGQKTDWIMHEYRLEDNDTTTDAQSLNNNGSEDGWVVCRVFKKKNLFKVGGNHEGGGGHGGGSNNNMSSATVAEHHQAALLMMNNNQQPRTLTLRDDASTHHQYLHGRQQQQQQHHMTTFDLYNNNISSSAADHHYSSIMQPQTSFLHNTHKPIGGGAADVGYADYSSSNPAMLKQLLSSNNQRADHCESGSTDDHSLCLAGGGLQQYHHQTPGTALDHHQVGNCDAPNDWAMLDRLVMTTTTTTATATAAHHLGGSGGGGQEVEVEVEEEESSKGAGVVRLFGDDEQQQQQQQHPNIINNSSSSSLHQINPHEQQLSLRGEMMDFWGYGK